MEKKIKKEEIKSGDYVLPPESLLIQNDKVGMIIELKSTTFNVKELIDIAYNIKFNFFNDKKINDVEYVK